MRVVVVGLGVQGKKRLAVAGDDVAATIDPMVPDAQYERIEQVPLDSFDAALVCTPDQAKVPVLGYLLAHRKHVLVEKPLLASDEEQLQELAEAARSSGVTCYTAYNHRFEPQVVQLKELLDTGSLGPIYTARLFYGNGTAADVRRSPWRDSGLGVLADLGSHLLDLTLFFFGRSERRFLPWSIGRFENQAADHFLVGSLGRPLLELEGSLLCWRNTFTVDVYGEQGSAHLDGLCKWGPSKLTVRRRVFPSGKPTEETTVLEHPDPTWTDEYDHFKRLCQAGGTNVENDLWINAVLSDIERAFKKELPV